MLNSYLFNNMDTGELQMKTIVIGDLMLDKYVFGIVFTCKKLLTKVSQVNKYQLACL